MTTPTCRYTSPISQQPAPASRHKRLSLCKWPILLLLSICCLFSPALAERYALVIGNATYASNPLKNPINDAKAVANKLTQMGFIVTYHEDLNRLNMGLAFQDFSEQLNPQTDIAFVFYAGHGLQYQQQSYLLPVNETIRETKHLPLMAWSADALLHQITTRHPKLTIFVLDACRDLPIPRSDRSTSRGLNAINTTGSSGSTIIAYATAEGEVAQDGNDDHSPYTSALLQYLDSPQLSVTDMFTSVTGAVKRQSGQQPWISMSVDTLYYLNAQPTHPPVVDNTTAAPITPMPQPIIDESIWMNAIWQWADEFQISHETIPRDPERLKSLSSLKLCHYDTCQRADLPKITYLPPEIGNLKQLQELYLFDNDLSTLPPEITNLKQLQTLFLDDNDLSTLPTEIGNLKQLQTLFLGRNDLSTLPTEITSLKQLQKLNLDSNDLSTLPPEIGNLKQLQKLYLDSNNLSTLPTEITNLKQLQELDLSSNDLSTLPAAITDLKQLYFLDLENNPKLQLTTAQRRFFKTISAYMGPE